MFGAAVFQVIARDRGDHDVLQPHPPDGFGDPLRLIFLERERFRRLTAQNPQARVQRSPAIIIVAVPWLQHSQRFGHCALSQTVCRRRSEMSALVEKKTGIRWQSDFDPGRFLRLVQCGIDLGAGHFQNG